MQTSAGVCNNGARSSCCASMTDPDLIRFVEAQTPVHHRVIEELTAGDKRTHWMWFVFPQLAGLGCSAMAQRYAIRDLDQARRYLADPTLGERLRHDVRLMLRHADKSAFQILWFSRRSEISLLRNALCSRGVER